MIKDVALLLQESILYSDNQDFMSAIHHYFYAVDCTSVYSNNQILVARPYGDLPTLCHNSIGNPITPMRFTGRMFGHECLGYTQIMIRQCVLLP